MSRRTHALSNPIPVPHPSNLQAHDRVRLRVARARAWPLRNPRASRGVVLLLLSAFAFGSGRCHAHPIVSTDVNRHVTLQVTGDRLEIRYIYEMLEIAAIEAARQWDADGDGTTSDPERDAFLRSWSSELRRDLHVHLNGAEVPLALETASWELGQGAFGLSTWKLHAHLTAPLAVAAATARLEYRDAFRPEQVGWKEVRLIARGTTGVAASSVPSSDRSRELTDFAAMSELPNPNETAAMAVLHFAGERPSTADSTSARSGSARAPPRQEHRRAPETERALPSAQSASSAGAVRTAPSSEPTAPGAAASEPSAAAWRHYAWPFFKLGVHHIATGYDHLLFLLGLLLFRQPLGRLVWVVSAFTVAHSITLAIAAAGWVTPPGGAVELLIAASIAYVGGMTLIHPRSRHGPWIALGFGLVHGFGFAGALSGSLVGVAGGRAWLIALFSFNVGIEAGQLFLVVIAYPLLRKLDRPGWSTGLRKLLSFVVLSAGLAWTVTRAGSLAG